MQYILPGETFMYISTKVLESGNKLAPWITSNTLPWQYRSLQVNIDVGNGQIHQLSSRGTHGLNDRPVRILNYKLYLKLYICYMQFFIMADCYCVMIYTNIIHVHVYP